MKILYLSAVCAQDRFERCVTEGTITKMPQAQKYHHLLIEGLQQVAEQPLTVISSYPIVGGKKKVYHTESESRLAWNTRAPILSAEEMEMLDAKD